MKPRSSFDWERVMWGAPDSAHPALCSHCCGGFRADETGVSLRASDGYIAVLCERCTEELAKEGIIERKGDGWVCRDPLRRRRPWDGL